MRDLDYATELASGAPRKGAAHRDRLEIARVAAAIAIALERGSDDDGFPYFGDDGELEFTHLIERTCPDPTAVLDETPGQWAWVEEFVYELRDRLKAVKE